MTWPELSHRASLFTAALLELPIRTTWARTVARCRSCNRTAVQVAALTLLLEKAIQNPHQRPISVSQSHNDLPRGYALAVLDVQISAVFQEPLQSKTRFFVGCVVVEELDGDDVVDGDAAEAVAVVDVGAGGEHELGEVGVEVGFCADGMHQGCGTGDVAPCYGISAFSPSLDSCKPRIGLKIWPGRFESS